MLQIHARRLRRAVRREGASWVCGGDEAKDDGEDAEMGTSGVRGGLAYMRTRVLMHAWVERDRCADVDAPTRLIAVCSESFIGTSSSGGQSELGSHVPFSKALNALAEILSFHLLSSDELSQTFFYVVFVCPNHRYRYLR